MSMSLDEEGTATSHKTCGGTTVLLGTHIQHGNSGVTVSLSAGKACKKRLDFKLLLDAL